MNGFRLRVRVCSILAAVTDAIRWRLQSELNGFAAWTFRCRIYKSSESTSPECRESLRTCRLRRRALMLLL